MASLDAKVGALTNEEQMSEYIFVAIVGLVLYFLRSLEEVTVRSKKREPRIRSKTLEPRPLTCPKTGKRLPKKR